MATFAVYLTAAMMRLEPPTDWEDILEVALKQMHCTWRRSYCTKQLHKALEVGLRFGIIRELNEKYYLYEYGKIDSDGNVTYEFTDNIFNQLADVSLTDDVVTNDSSHMNGAITDILTKWGRVGPRANERVLRDLCQMDLQADPTETDTETIENDNMPTQSGRSGMKADGNAIDDNLENNETAQHESDILMPDQLIGEHRNLFHQTDVEHANFEEENQVACEMDMEMNETDSNEDQYNATSNGNDSDNSKANSENVILEDFELNQMILSQITSTNGSEDFANFMDNIINEMIDIDESAAHGNESEGISSYMDNIINEMIDLNESAEHQRNEIENVNMKKMLLHFPLKRKMLNDCYRDVKRLKTD